jgi:hypothetical protein
MKVEHETRDADTGSLFLIIGLLLLSGVVILLGVWILMRSLATREAAQQSSLRVREVAGAFPKPTLETRPGVDLHEILGEETARLNSYGWIDHNTGIAHIPIDRAMEIILARGLPDVGGGQTPLQLLQSRPEQDRP